MLQLEPLSTPGARAKLAQERQNMDEPKMKRMYKPLPQTPIPTKITEAEEGHTCGKTEDRDDGIWLCEEPAVTCIEQDLCNPWGDSIVWYRCKHHPWR